MKFKENGVWRTKAARYAGTARLAAVPGGVFWIRWYESSSQKWLRKIRRTWATMLPEQPGVNIYEVQERIGHSDLEMLKRYNAVAQARSARSRKQMKTFAESVEFNRNPYQYRWERLARTGVEEKRG